MVYDIWYTLYIMYDLGRSRDIYCACTLFLPLQPKWKRRQHVNTTQVYFHNSEVDLKNEWRRLILLGLQVYGFLPNTGQPGPGLQLLGELRMSPNHVQREEIKLSEEEGASPPCKALAPPLTWNTSPLGAPPAPRLCGLTLWSRGPKCEKTFNCENEWRCHAHEVHHLCMKVLKRDPAPCPYPGH